MIRGEKWRLLIALSQRTSLITVLDAQIDQITIFLRLYYLRCQSPLHYVVVTLIDLESPLESEAISFSDLDF